MSKKHHTEPNCCNDSDPMKTFTEGPQMMELDIKPLNLKKSIFFPTPAIIKSFTFRKYLIGVQVPLIQILHHNPRWLLLQCQNLSTDFFQKLNSLKLGNPYHQLLRLFKSFAFLLKVYGFFQVNSQMIFTNKNKVKVWINSDVFSDERMIPLDSQNMGEKQFVQSFFTMVQKYVQDWDIVENIETIAQSLNLLKYRSRLIKRSKTIVDSCKMGSNKNQKSFLSFETNQMGPLNSSKFICNSNQEIESSGRFNEFKPQLSCITVKRYHSKKQRSYLANNRMRASKELNTSILAYKSLRTSNQFRRTNKKIALTSTSSTIDKFIQKQRYVVAKRVKKDDKLQPNDVNQQIAPTDVEANGIQNQLQGLFEEQNKQFQLGVQPNSEELQKIIQQMQQVLIW